ncbi:unnamed protein product, partial [Oikopleura dioica]
RDIFKRGRNQKNPSQNAVLRKKSRNMKTRLKLDNSNELKSA